MARERRVFSEEFKSEAVKLVGQPGASKVAIARDLGVGANLLGRWCRDVDVDAEVAVGNEKVSAQEYERVRRELAKVKTERDILKNRPTRSPVALRNRNSRRVHWMHAETVRHRPVKNLVQGKLRTHLWRRHLATPFRKLINSASLSCA